MLNEAELDYNLSRDFTVVEINFGGDFEYDVEYAIIKNNKLYFLKDDISDSNGNDLYFIDKKAIPVKKKGNTYQSVNKEDDLDIFTYKNAYTFTYDPKNKNKVICWYKSPDDKYMFDEEPFKSYLKNL